MLPKSDKTHTLPEGQHKLTNIFMSAIRQQIPPFPFWAEGRKGKAALVSNFSVPPKVAEVRKGRQPLVSNFCELGSSSSLFVSWEIKYI
jgi:hypothetical protein